MVDKTPITRGMIKKLLAALKKGTGISIKEFKKLVPAYYTGDKKRKDK